MSAEARDARRLLEEYADMGGRSAFDLKSGRHCEGYILEVEEDHMLFGHGGPLAPDEPERIPLGDVDLGSLSFFDEERQCWMDARWDEALGRWKTTVTPRAAAPPPAPPPRGERPWWKFW